MKRIFTIYSLGLILLSFAGFSQTFSGTTNLSGNLGDNTTADTEGTIAITSSLQSVSGGAGTFIKYNNLADFYGVNLSFASVAVANRLRARAGVPFSITINTSRIKWGNQTIVPGGVDQTRIRYGIGQNEQGYRYDVDVINAPNTVIPDPNNKLQTFTINHTFAVGRTEAWIVLEVSEINGADFLNPYFTTIIIPFVVEGPTKAIVDSLGVTTEPQKPYMVLHQPPGSQSTASILSTQKTCRNYEETYETDETNSARAAVKIGFKGSLGIGVQVDTEIYAQFSGGVATNDVEIRTKSDETCIQVNTSITTVALATANNAGTNGDLFIGYGIDLVYGVSRNVNINNNVISIDTGLVFAPIPETMKRFVLTKAAILEDIENQTAIMNNLNLSPKERATAEYQIDVWNKTLQLNETNIAQAIANPAGKLNVGTGPVTFSAGSNETFSKGLDYTSTASIETKKYFEFNVGFDFLVELSGSGYSGGYQFTSRSTYGERKSTSSNTGTMISYEFQDNDLGDLISTDIYRDPMFGTPVFKLLSGTRTSCPFEGGYQLDQPALNFTATASKTQTINNVTLGQPANFKLNICNNSNYPRTYVLKVKNESIPSNMTILANGGTNITSTPITLSVGANTCLYNRDLDISRTLPTVPTAINNLVLEWYADCEPDIKDSLVLNASWATPPPPVLGALPDPNPERNIYVCGAVPPISLNATCSGATQPYWYKSPTGGVTLGTNSITDNNAADGDEYFVSCQSSNYISPRSFYGKVTLHNSPVLITESGPLSFCGPGSVTFNSYADNNNKALSLVKANNQYVEVPHSNSLNLSTSFTFEAWVNYSGVNSAILDKGNYDFLWMLNANGNANKLGYYERGNGWKYSTGAVPENTWTHVAITLQGGFLRFYINGAASGIAFLGTAFQDNLPMNIGRQQPSACQCNHFNGSMDELRLWNVAKSQAEIQASMKTGVAHNSAGLVAYYKFNEASGNSIIDATGNDNHGVLMNGASRQTALTVPFNELDVLWAPVNLTASSFTATTSGTYTASVDYGLGCTTSVNKTVSVNSNAALVSLSSPTDDFASDTVFKTASSTNGKIVATNKITGTAKVTYRAKSLELNAGFIADGGTVFNAEIGGCPN